MRSPAAVPSSPSLPHRVLPPQHPTRTASSRSISDITKSASLLGRRSLILLSVAGAICPLNVAESNSVASPYFLEDAPNVITDRVFMDFSVCPSYFRADRPIGSDLAVCPNAEPLGRVVFGLYGKLVPRTVANFKALCSPSGYRGTLVHKIFQGQFFVAGRQGKREKGEVQLPGKLARNTETVEPKAFQLKHSRPGTLSLCLSKNDDDDEIKLDPDYRNVEFLVTTGPGPCPELDGENIVFGTVLEGMDVITTIAAIPTYKPAEKIRELNAFAVFLGDDRAQIARSMWDRPIRTVYISDCGELRVANPPLSPSLP